MYPDGYDSSRNRVIGEWLTVLDDVVIDGNMWIIKAKKTGRYMLSKHRNMNPEYADLIKIMDDAGIPWNYEER